MALITGLIRENVSLSVFVEKYGQDGSGGTERQALGTAIATGVSALFASPAGNRAGDFHSDNETETATLVSSSPYVDRQDCVFQITAVNGAPSELVGTYWRVTGPQSFPVGSLGIIPARYEAKVSRYVPAS